jgi:hypothetical protein
MNIFEANPESFYQGMTEPEQGEPEPEKTEFKNPCPVCGKSLDYEGDIKDICTCDENEDLI